MKLTTILFFAVFILLIRCSTPTDQMSSTETTNGSITGKLVDGLGNPEAGAEVRLYEVMYVPAGVNVLKKSVHVLNTKDTSVLTNLKGEYVFAWPGKGMYNIVGKSEDGLSVLISSIDIQDTSGTFYENIIGTDTVKVPGECSGVLQMVGANGNDQSQAVVYLRGTDFITVPDKNGLFFVKDVPLGMYTLVIRPNYSGYHEKEFSINVKSGEVASLDTTFITVDTNLNNNKAPVISGLRDTIISINDTVNFSVTAKDSNGIINRYHWTFKSFGISHVDTTVNGLCTYAFPSSPAICTVTVAVSDSLGKTGSQSAMVTVVRDPPVADAGHDTTVVVNTTYTLHGSGTDRFGKIVKYRFDTDEDGLFEDSSSVSGIKQFKAPSIPGTFVVIIQVEDDDGNTANSMILLDVESKE